MVTLKKDTLSTQPKLSIQSAAEFLNISVQAVHKQLKGKNIHCPKFGNKSYLTYEESRQLFGLKFEQSIIVGQIVKGGTGKTTTIDNVASCINSYGARVLKIDADPQGNLTDLNGIDAEEHPVLIDALKGETNIKDCIINISQGMDLIPSRIENVVLDNVIVNERMPLHTLYSDLLGPIIKEYDYIFIDCPPTMGQAVTAASLFADIILVPLNPDKFSAKGLKILKQEVETLNSRYRKNILYKVFLNKFSSKTILSDKAIVSLISDPDLEGKVLSTTVQYSQEIPNLTDENKNLFNQIKKSIVRDDYDRLTRELLDIKVQNRKEHASNDIEQVKETELA